LIPVVIVLREPDIPLIFAEGLAPDANGGPDNIQIGDGLVPTELSSTPPRMIGLLNIEKC
jgi:hypothetical protein